MSALTDRDSLTGDSSAGAEETLTPTLTMVALGARVAWWTALIVTIGFATLTASLIIELA